MCNHPMRGRVLGDVCSECPSALARDMTTAFPSFVAHHQDLVYGLARRWSRQGADAEDLAQEAFIRAYRALQKYDDARLRDLRPRGWLARIVVNLAHNRARGRSLHEPPLESVPDHADAAATRPEAAFERREAASMWRELLDGLPPAYRVAVGLRHVDGLSYPELSEALGRPLGTVKSDVHRGVRLLRLAYEARQAAERDAAPSRFPAGRAARAFSRPSTEVI